MKGKYSWQRIVIFLLYAITILLEFPEWLGICVLLVLLFSQHTALAVVFAVVWFVRRFIQAVCLELIGKIMFK